jgi:hypothetical protein
VNYIQVLCQPRLCKADHGCLTYLMLQRHLSHLNNVSFTAAIFAVCRIYTGVVSKETYIDTMCFGPIIYTYIHCTLWGTGCNLVAPLLVYPLA